MDITRVALYIRVSTDEQVREGYSLEAQKAHLIEYAKSKNYSVVGLYADEGISARKSYKKRKAFMRLLDDVEAGKIDLILFIKLDRWFRSVPDYYKVQEVLEANNVGWRATMEQYDTTSANGRLYINIRLAVAQDEADRTSERIKFVFDRKVTESEVISGRVPLGYKKEGKHLVIEEEGAELVRDVFSRYLILRSKRAVALQFRKKYGERISYGVVGTMLSNEKYIGKYRDNHNYCPAIIDKKTFEEAKAVASAGACRSSSDKADYFYIFSGLLVCPRCGHKLSGCKSGTNKYNKIYYYYRCNSFVFNNDCKFDKRVSESKLEKYLLENIAEEAKKYKVDYELSLRKKIKPATNKRTIEGKLARLRNLYINELIEIEDYKKEYDLLNKELQELAELSVESEKDFSKLESLLAADFKTMYYSLDNQRKRALWHTIIEKIAPQEDGGYQIFFK